MAAITTQFPSHISKRTGEKLKTLLTALTAPCAYYWRSYMNNSHMRTHVSKGALRCSLKARHPTSHRARSCGLSFSGLRHPRARHASATELLCAFQAGCIRRRTIRTRFEAMLSRPLLERETHGSGSASEPCTTFARLARTRG